jgi:hypothetical protein
MPAFVPIIIAGANVVRMVAPAVARSLTQSGFAKKATQKMIDSMKGYIPKATKKEAENLAKKPVGRTSPTSAPKPKNTGTGAGTRSASRARLKRERDTAKKEEAARKEKEDKTNQRKIIENLNKRNLPAKTNKPLTTTGGRSVTTTGGRSVTTTGGRSGTTTGGRSGTKNNGRNEKVVGISKEGAKAANRASQFGTAGTEDKNNEQNKKLKPVPEVNVRTLPEPKTVPEPKAKTKPAPITKYKPEKKTAPTPKPKPKEKFDTEGGLYKQYEWAKKRDLPIGGATQKYYDQMENVALNKKGGMIKKSAVKKRKGFSGRGAGAARRGF